METTVFYSVTELRDNLSLKLKWAGSHFRAFPALITFWQRQPELSTAECEIHCSSRPLTGLIVLAIVIKNSAIIKSEL